MREALELRHRVTARDPRVPRRRGLPRRRDARSDPLDPGGRPRLPRPQPHPAGLLLRPAPVAAALQADADDRRLRALLPDRPLLPGRGPARRSPARLHPARRRALLRRRRRRDRGQRTAAGPRLRAGRRPHPGPADAAAALRRGDLPLRQRPPRHPLRPRARRPGRRAGRDRVQGLPRGDRRWRRGPRPQRRGAGDAAVGPRRPHLTGAGARRQGPRLGLPRGRRMALPDRQVPHPRGAQRAERAARRRGGRPAARGRRQAQGRQCGPRPAAARPRGRVRPDPRGLATTCSGSSTGR